MYRKLLSAVALVLVLPLMLFAQDGKLRGTVTDSQSGEPLIGANVIIDGTSLGSSSDINGEYIILGVPPGSYTVKASYIGYAPVTISNVRVNSNITTTQDFQLSSTAIQTGEVEVIAARPLIQRNTTNTVRMQTQDDIKTLPFRGLQNIIALSAGVVQQDGTLYVRGGRAGEVAYFIDGATATNPLYNSEGISPIQEAIEEIQLQSGGYTADRPGANSGSVQTTMRTGSSSALKVTFDYQTDDFASPGEQFLGTSARGYRNVVATVSGPVPMMPSLRFFLAGQHNFLRNRTHMFIEPFSFENLTTDGFGTWPEGTALPGPVEMKQNYLYKNWRNENTVQGTLLWDAQPFKVRFSGSYTNLELPTGRSMPTGLNNLLWQREYRNETNSYLGNLRLTHVLDSKTFYEVGISMMRRDFLAYDPDYEHNWTQYSDSAAARRKGYIMADGSTGFQTRYLGPPNYSVIYAFGLTHEYQVNNAYEKNDQQNIGVTIDFTSQVNSQWEVKAGGRIDTWSMSQFRVGDISSYNTFLDNPGTYFAADSLAAFPERALEYDLTIQRRGVMNIYGYDSKGHRIDEGFDGPRKPLFASAYIQNKFEFDDLVLNAGVRYELFDMKNVAPTNYVDPTWNEDINYFADQESQLKETDPVHLLLPRVSFSFPVTDNTVFYGMYGKYAQYPVLDRLYDGTRQLAARISPRSRVGYSLGSSPAGTGFLVSPERTTQYEVGIRQTLTDNFAFTATGFYKDLRDQIQQNRIYNSAGVPIFVAYGNSDFGTVKGLELTFELRRTNRVQARINYTLSDARGTASNPSSSRNAVSDGSGTSTLFPSFINPLDYNQPHRGSILVDYRWGKGDGGPVLEGFGANFLMTFNSGHAYTKIKEPENLGQASPWNIGVRPIIDPRTRNPVEPLNSSSTPWVLNVDLNASKVFYFEGFTAELYVNVLNLFDTKHVDNIFPNTGTPTDDGWLRSPLARSYVATENYADFYRAVNIDNRHAYIGATGNDIFGTPRQIRVGLKLEI
ncbi:MAG: TonB-dependent receptor [Ignavibacteriae bacterium]|nr:TonB-dependent receptor [Ignavibacteriota bacterium]